MSPAGSEAEGDAPEASASGRLRPPRRPRLRPAAFAVAAAFVAAIFATCLDAGAAAAPCGVFAAPAPALLRIMALGHERALARLLWSRARVAHGACFARRQRFEGAAPYVDAVRALDPSFREPYRYVEAFVASAPGRPSPLLAAGLGLRSARLRVPSARLRVPSARLRVPSARRLARHFLAHGGARIAYSCTTTREPGCSADDCTPCQPAGRGGSDQRKMRLASRGARLTQPWLCWRPKLSCQKAPCRAYDSK
jgi:hypothetical protein